MAASNKTAVCPNTSILDKMTLKGGVDAGVYKDHGTVKSMDLCRRICCEMTECHLAFMLGTNCFSVKCASVDSCRALKAKPSSYYPKVSARIENEELIRCKNLVLVPVFFHLSKVLKYSY